MQKFSYRIALRHIILLFPFRFDRRAYHIDDLQFYIYGSRHLGNNGAPENFDSTILLTTTADNRRYARMMMLTARANLFELFMPC